MKDFISNPNSLPDAMFGGLSSKFQPSTPDEDIPSFGPELTQASSEETAKKFEEIEGLKYKMVDEDDAYITQRRSQPQPEDDQKEKRVAAPDSNTTQQTVQLSEPVVNPHVPLNRLFVTPESINRHLAPFSVATRGILSESVQVIQSRLQDGRVGHTFSFDKPGIQVQFESDGDKLLVRVKGELPLSPASEELIRHQAQLLGYLQEIFPDKELTVSLEPDTLPDGERGGQDSQENSREDQSSEPEAVLEETE